MKLCKDCKYYVAEVSGDGGTLLPGFAFYFPALCTMPEFSEYVSDPIEGNHRYINMFCKDNRSNELKCGAAGTKFDPATLDGRLAMLPWGE